MIKQIIIKFDTEGRSQWSYALYGALMEQLPPETSVLFHQRGIMPVSQFYLKDEWTISLFGKNICPAKEALLKLKFCSLDKYGVNMQVTDIKEQPTVTERELIDRYMAKLSPRREVTMRFLTPTAFKSNGVYVNIPSVRLVIQSLMLKWQEFADEYSLTDPEVLEHLTSHTAIKRYSLSSASYQLKGVRIPAFTGSMTFSVKGPEQLARLMNLLMSFGGYSGVGIKTALGMGGCEVIL